LRVDLFMYTRNITGVYTCIYIYIFIIKIACSHYLTIFLLHVYVFFFFSWFLRILTSTGQVHWGRL
jgi:hypothetical protein